VKMMKRHIIWLVIFIVITVLLPETLLAEGGGEEHGGNPLVDLGWRVLNFIIFAAILYFAASKPVRNFLNGRIEGIKKQLEDAENAKAEAEKRATDCMRKLESLEEEIKDICDTLQKEGEVERERIIEAAHIAAEKIKAQAEFSAEQELKKAIMAIKEEAAEAALEIAGKMLVKEIKKEDQKKLVSEYIESIRGVN